jgi:acyl-CoA dehydrogenase
MFMLSDFEKCVVKWLRHKMPAISPTEREAITSGDIWVDAPILQGKICWDTWMQLPLPVLSHEEKNFLEQQTHTLCGMLDDWHITYELNNLSAKVWQYLKQEKFFALHIPKEYGGLGFSAAANSAIVQKIASRSLTAAVTVMVPNSLGPAELLLKYGTVEQREEYLPALAEGRHIPCFALTSVEAGSDATSIKDTGIICKGRIYGREVIGIKLNWSKRYITLAPVATLLGLAVKVYDPEHLLGEQEDLGITVCLVPVYLSGVNHSKRHIPLNLPFMNGPSKGEDVFVPLDAIIGGPAMLGKGWQMLIECLSVGRGISLPALSTGSSKLAFRTAGAYAAVRKQFGLPIGKFEGIVAALAKIGGYTYLLEATRLFTLAGIDAGKSPAVITAIAKYHMTEMARAAVNAAMDIHGGRGIILGPKNYLASTYQALPISITVEGANILTRNLMIFGQGVMRCHPFLKEEFDVLTVTQQNTGVLKNFCMVVLKHVAYASANLAKLLLHTVTGFYMTRTWKKERVYTRHLKRMSLVLACMTDISLLCLGAKLKRKEALSARLGDILSYLYLSLASLRYYYASGALREERCFLRWSMAHCLHQMQQALETLLQNFPQRWLGRILHIVFITCAPKYTPPLDADGAAIAEVMLYPNGIRERIASDMYFEKQVHDAVGCLELALEQLPVDLADTNAINEYQHLLKIVLAVDEFNK